MKKKYRVGDEITKPAEKLLYCCPFCRYNTEEGSDIHYHIVGYHRVLQEFFNDY